MADERFNRRRFFRAALGELLKPIERAAAPLERAIREIGALEDTAAASIIRPPKQPTVSRSAQIDKQPTVWLRPPGALPEAEFRDTCSRCGECVNVCPVRCIQIEPGSRGDGLPFIDAADNPCVLCSGLNCMEHCPTGALELTPRNDIDMGTAVWHESTCMRTRGDECTICIDQCPIGASAIDLYDGKVRVKVDGCVGCGVCEHDCPTSPKSITITPRAARN